jgi:lysophospholipid acyltransferase (LPLAT)-like uncharacterized protein
MGTLKYQIHREEPTVDPVVDGFEGPNIYLFWHEYIPIPFYLRGRCNITMLLSRHRDAEWLSHAARYMGFGTVRGSSSRGGVASLKKLMQVGKEMNLTMTPDGPRGPRRVLAPGCIYLASRLKIPLVCLGFGYNSCWRMENAWDRFAIPKPFTQARMMIGRRIHIPEGLDRDGIEHYRELVQDVLEQKTVCAEHWAKTGAFLEGQQVLLPEPGSRPRAA